MKYAIKTDRGTRGTRAPALWKKIVVLLLMSIVIGACNRKAKIDDYRVHTRDSANFSIIAPEIEPKERIVVKINNEIIWNSLGKDSLGNPGSWRYYRYPRKIKKVQFIDYYRGIQKINKEFNDTLLDVAQRTLIITRLFPKDTTNPNWRRYRFISIDTGMRRINLVNDAVKFKGTWTDEVH